MKNSIKKQRKTSTPLTLTLSLKGRGEVNFDNTNLKKRR